MKHRVHVLLYFPAKHHQLLNFSSYAGGKEENKTDDRVITTSSVVICRTEDRPIERDGTKFFCKAVKVLHTLVFEPKVSE
jgi:hypothetical protein